MRFFKSLFVTAICVVLIGCGSEQLPYDTRISIAPGSKEFTVGAEFKDGMFCFTDGGLYQDVPLLIAVTDGDNAPIGDAEVGVYADYTANTFNSVDMLQLYSDNNGNGVIDGPEELVTSSTSGVYKAKTDKYHGTTMLMLRMYLTCPYRGDVFAFVGASTFSMQVAVSYATRQSQTTGGGTDGGGTDSGTTDGGDTDGGETDTGTSDGGFTDGGGADAGTTDGGTTGGGGTDGGTTDGRSIGNTALTELDIISIKTDGVSDRE